MAWQNSATERKPKRLPVVLTRQEAEKLLQQPTLRYRTGRRDHCMLKLMLRTGLRCQETLDLTVNDIDWLSGRMHIKNGKGKKDRIVWVNDDMLAEMRRWSDERPASAQDLLFTTLKGTPIYPSAMRAMVKRRAAKAGLGHKDIHPHTLRHTFATELYRHTRDIKLVQKAMGHTSIMWTLVYTHLVDDEYEQGMRGFVFA